jgi:SnoaL-like domain
MSTMSVNSVAALNGVTSPKHILLSILATLSGGKISEAVGAFSDQFTFIDNALGLTFTDKNHLTEFFQKSRELFPDTELVVISAIECGDHVVAQWKLTAVEVLPYPGLGSANFRRPFSLPGLSVVEFKHARIVNWSDYYDLPTSRRMGLGAFFEEWIEL